jgi:transposase-like protein
MLAFSQPTSRQERREWWRRQVARQQSGNRSVTEFCRQLGVSPSRFYYWRNRVREGLPNAHERLPAEYRSRHLSTPTGAASTNFVPLSIIDPAAGAQLEIELTNACVVRLKGAIDPAMLEAAIAAAGELDGSREGAR